MITSLLLTPYLSGTLLAQTPTPLPTNTRPSPSVTVKDYDNDGIADSNDECPNLPAKRTLNGCPNIQLFAGGPRPNGIYFQASPFFDLNLVEKTQIQRGDLFKAVLLDKILDEPISESPSVRVTD